MTATVLKKIPTEPVPVTSHGRATRPAKPANYDALEYAEQVEYHVAVIRWNEAHPEIVQAEEKAEREKKMAAKRAERVAFEAEIEAGRKMTAPPARPDGPNRHEDPVAVKFGTAAYRAHWKKWTDWDKLLIRYAMAHGLPDGHERHHKETLKDLRELREAYEREDRQEKTDAEFIAKYGDGKREPPNNSEGVSYGVWCDAYDAWTEAHPDVISRRKAKEKAEYDAWIKEGSPEALEAFASDAEYEAGEAASNAKAIASEARRIKREAKNPAAALERARDEAQREEMDGSGEKDEAKADARQNGESWSDIKDEWEEQWLEDNWTPEAEAEFVVSFENQWLKDHGTPFPELAEAA